MNRTTLLTLLSLLLSGSLYAQQEIILSNLSGRSSSALQGSSFGVPFPRGSVFPGDTFTLEGSGHQSLGADTYPLAYWSDGSLKWLGVAGVFPSTSEGSTLSLKVSPAPKKTRKSAPVPAGSIARQTPDGIEVNTGAMSRGYRTTPYPSSFILSMIKERKVPITITTDCHDKAYLSYGMEEAKTMLREKGFKEYMLLGDDGFYPVSL